MQVLFAEEELEEMRQCAGRQGLTLSEWVRRTLRDAVRRTPAAQADYKLEAIRAATNVPMYLVGTDHPHKVDAQRLLERAVADGARLVTNAEVFQEILHRYASIDRRDAIPVCYHALLGVVDEVLPVELQDAVAAKDLLLGSKDASARDAIHVAVMKRHAIRTIMSFDRGFEGFAGIERLG